MVINKSWGFISISIGVVSLLWGGGALCGMIEQKYVLTEISSVMNAFGSDVYSAYYLENTIAEERHKNIIVLISGISMTTFGSLLMKY
ncbi:molybdenum cofactor biosynthesis protein [Photobacterium piscicola]|uniref:molybdenum cofactor biosynthesis protein n=1 Tax=Photobacterium piscicola TaxID=1378299 RepID=UPI0038CFB61C